MPVKQKEPGVFEKSYRSVHQRAKRDHYDAVRVILQIRRAALVAQLKFQQRKGGK